MLRRSCSCLTALMAAAVSPAIFAAPDGHLDPGFGQNGLQTVGFDLVGAGWDLAYGLAVLPDGRILLAGDVYGESGNGIGLARLTADGQPDEGFGQPWYLPAGVTDVAVTDAVLQPDGKLVVAGYGFVASTSQALVCRFLPDGSIDTGFATAQPNLMQPGCRLLTMNDDNRFYAVTVQRDGHIALAGYADTNNSGGGMVVRLDGQGNFDSGFIGDGIRIFPNLALVDIAETPAGDLVAVGNDNDNFGVLRLCGADGTLDDTFGDGGATTIAIDHVEDGWDAATSVVVLPDGRIVIGGFAEGGPDLCPAVARLLPNGELDDSLDADGVFVAADSCLGFLSIDDMLVQSDDRIVLAGSSNSGFFATRVLPQGGYDTAFGEQGMTWFDFGSFYGLTQTYSAAYRIASHAGRLLLAGRADHDFGNMDFGIARLDNDLIYADDLE